MRKLLAPLIGVALLLVGQGTAHAQNSMGYNFQCHVLELLSPFEALDLSIFEDDGFPPGFLDELKNVTHVTINGQTSSWSDYLNNLANEVEAFESQEVTVRTDCSEYNQKAAKLKTAQDAAKKRLKDAQKLKEDAAQDAKDAEAKKKTADEAVTDAEKLVTDADVALDKAKDAMKDLQKAIIGSIDGASQGPFDKPPSGSVASVGGESGIFPQFDGGGVHLKDEAAVNTFIEKLGAFNKELKAAKNDIDDAKKAKENAEKDLTTAKNNAKKAADEKKAADKAHKAACDELENAEKGLEKLNSLITKCNNKFQECEKKVHELKVAQAKAENAMEDAGQDIKDAKASSGGGGGPADDVLDEAEKKLESAGTKLEADDFEGAEQDAKAASSLAGLAERLKKACDCIEEAEKKLAEVEKELKDAKAANPLVDFSDTQALIDSAKISLRQAKEAKDKKLTQSADRYCNQAKTYLDRADKEVEDDVKEYQDEQEFQVQRNGNQARGEREKKKIEDSEILETLKAFESEIAAVLEGIDKSSDIVQKLIDLAKKAGIDIKDGDKLVDILKKINQTLKAAGETGQEFNDNLKKLNEFLNTTFYDFLKDKLKDVLLKVSSELVKKGLGVSGGPLTAMVAVWGEAWDLGLAIGDAIVATMLKVNQQIFAAEVATNNLCDPKTTKSQPTRAIPMRIDTYVEIVDEDGNVLDGEVELEMKTSTGGSTTEYDIDSGDTEEETSNKIRNHIPTPDDVKVNDLTCDDGTPKTLKTIVVVNRYCEADHIRVEVNVRVIVSGCK